jgi:hypothetical protein
VNRDTVTLPVTPDLADLADACGLGADELAAEAVRRYVDGEATRVRFQAMRLAKRHQRLLERLGA